MNTTGDHFCPVCWIAVKAEHVQAGICTTYHDAKPGNPETRHTLLSYLAARQWREQRDQNPLLWNRPHILEMLQNGAVPAPPKTHRTSNGTVLTRTAMENLANKAEAGYDPSTARGTRRPYSYSPGNYSHAAALAAGR
jgi:hypothetical protein